MWYGSGVSKGNTPCHSVCLDWGLLWTQIYWQMAVQRSDKVLLILPGHFARFGAITTVYQEQKEYDWVD